MTALANPGEMSLLQRQPNELLERVTRGWHQPFASAPGHRHLGHVEVATRIDPDPVRDEEVARGTGIRASAPACLEDPAAVEDADPAAGSAGFRGAGAGPAARVKAQLRHVNPAGLLVDQELKRPGHVVPLSLIAPVRREELEAAVLAVGDVDRAVLVHGQAMRDVKLARTAPRLAPRLEQAAVRRETMDARVAVAVRDVEITRRS